MPATVKTTSWDVVANGLDRLLKPVTGKMRAVSAVAIGIMSIPIFFDVLARFVLHKSLPGIIELEEFFMVIIVFLALASAHQKEGHISIELLTCRLSAPVRRALDVFNNATCALFFGLMAYRMFLAALKKAGEYSAMLKIPVNLFMGLAVLGLAALTLVLLEKGPSGRFLPR